MIILQRQFLGCCGFQKFQIMTVGKLINSTIFLYPMQGGQELTVKPPQLHATENRNKNYQDDSKTNLNLGKSNLIFNKNFLQFFPHLFDWKIFNSFCDCAKKNQLVSHGAYIKSGKSFNRNIHIWFIFLINQEQSLD